MRAKIRLPCPCRICVQEGILLSYCDGDIRQVETVEHVFHAVSNPSTWEFRGALLKAVGEGRDSQAVTSPSHRITGTHARR